MSQTDSFGRVALPTWAPYALALLWLAAGAVAAGSMALEGKSLAGAAVLVVSWSFLLALLLGLQPHLRVGWKGMALVVCAGVIGIPSYLYSLPSALPVDVDPSRVLVLLFVLTAFTVLLVDDSVRFNRTAFDAPLLTLSAVVFVSLIVNFKRFDPTWESAMAVKSLFYFVALVFLYWTITAVMTTEDVIDSILKAIVTMGAVVAVLGIVEFITGFNVFWHLHEALPFLQMQAGRVVEAARNGNDRISGSTAHPIAFAALLIMILPLSLHYWFDSTDRSKRLGYALASLMIAFAALLTVSRTAVVGLTATGIMIAVQRPELRRRLVGSALVLAIAVHLLVPGLTSGILDGLNPVAVYQSELGATKEGPGRLEDYPRILQQLELRPLLGRAFGTYDPGHYSYVDNQYLMFIAELGLAGTVSVIWLLYAAVTKPLRAAHRLRSDKAGLLCALSASALVFALCSACFDSFGFPQVAYLFFILIALAASYMNVVRSQDRFPANEVAE